LQEAAAGVDLLVVECSAPEGFGVAGHLTPSQVGRICAVAQPGRVVLTHQYPAAAAADLVADVARYYSGPVTQASDGNVFHVPLTSGEVSP
jgi:ribonuclease BN (tRNA processing enzyme)